MTMTMARSEIVLYCFVNGAHQATLDEDGTPLGSKVKTMSSLDRHLL